MSDAARNRDTLRVALDAWGAGGTLRQKVERLWDERELELQQLQERVERLEAFLYLPARRIPADA